MLSFRFPLSLMVLIAFGGMTGLASAGDFEDCMSRVATKIESGCSAIISDASKPMDDRVKAYVRRSGLFAVRAKPDLALADAEAAVQLNPKSVSALLARSYANQRSGKFELALADASQAIEIEPKNPVLYFARGNIKNDQKKWADALADLDQAITLRQDYAQAHVSRARAFVETGQLDSALADLNTAISINAAVQGAYFWRG
jgi:tetratricopeptide (TPR) repeat protein